MKLKTYAELYLKRRYRNQDKKLDDNIMSDGDVLSNISFMTKEARQEARELLNSISYYISPNGKSLKRQDRVTDIVGLTLTK